MHVELIATDGKVQKRILWVDVTSNGVYSGHCHEKRDIHISYHFDGNVYDNWSGKTRKTGVLPALKDLKGCHQLVGVGFTSDLSRMHDTPLYHLKKLDAIVNIDVRQYKRGVGCQLYMVKPNGHDIIGQMMKWQNRPQVTEIHTFTRCNPWISLVLYSDVYKEPQI